MRIIQILLFSFFFAQFLASCGITYKVRNTKNELEELLFFPCGNVGIELVGRGNSKFTITQRFALNEKVEFFTDSLSVMYNGIVISKEAIKMADDLVGKDIEVSQNEQFEFRFELGDGVFDGDTIAIFAPAFIKCREDFITLDTVFYTFANRLRIYGVNAL